MYLDLDELDDVFQHHWLWSTKHPSVAQFKRSDHLGDHEEPLKQCVYDLVLEKSGRRLRGPICLLTHLNYLGFGFNPVSFYYCFDPNGSKVETIVAEVNNTPWGEQHTYVLDIDSAEENATHLHHKPAKEFHVSPFMPMNIRYDWRFSRPREQLAVHMENYLDDDKIFDATLTLKRRSINSMSLASVLIRYPIVTVKVVLGIYYQALRLWLKKTPFYPHPKEKEAPQSASGL